VATDDCRKEVILVVVLIEGAKAAEEESRVARTVNFIFFNI
jgi:hypothetical protein